MQVFGLVNIKETEKIIVYLTGYNNIREIFIEYNDNIYFKTVLNNASRKRLTRKVTEYLVSSYNKYYTIAEFMKEYEKYIKFSYEV